MPPSRTERGREGAARRPEGGRKARKAYAARPYLEERDAGFYGLAWAAGMCAFAGGAKGSTLLAGGALWAAWLFLAWRIAAWLRAQEDFDSGAVDAMASASAVGILGGFLPVLAGLGALIATHGQRWWDPIAAAAIAGVAGTAAAAFLERHFDVGALWSLAAVVGGLGHPDPPVGFAAVALAFGIWYLVVTAAQGRAFRHFENGRPPEVRHLGTDLLVPAALLAASLAAAWAWTPAMKPRPVRILPRWNLQVKLPGEGRARIPIPLFGEPDQRLFEGGSENPSAGAEGLEGLLATLMTGTGRALGGAILALAAVGGFVAWRLRKRRAAEAAAWQERRQETLRGRGVAPKAKAAAPDPPADPREAVVYWYNRLRGELEGFGIARAEALTPAEYAEAVSGRPNLGDAPLGEMTELFHRAEYSHHPVDPGDRECAAGLYARTLEKAGGRASP